MYKVATVKDLQEYVNAKLSKAESDSDIKYFIALRHAIETQILGRKLLRYEDRCSVFSFIAGIIMIGIVLDLIGEHDIDLVSINSNYYLQQIMEA